jgi:hypothetical protein
MMIVLGVSVIAFGFGRVKNAEFLRLHRWVMSMAVILMLGPILFVMLPATFTFYTDPDVLLFSSMSIITVIHGAVGLPTVVLGLVFLTNDVPKAVKPWMRRTATLTILSLGLGLLLFLTMMDLISFGM